MIYGSIYGSNTEHQMNEAIKDLVTSFYSSMKKEAEKVAATGDENV